MTFLDSAALTQPQFDIKRLHSEDVDFDMAARLQEIAFQGWGASVGYGRTTAELLTQFNPSDPKHVRAKQAIYNEYASQELGGLYAAYDERSAFPYVPVGFLLAHQTVEGGRMLNRLKSAINRSSAPNAHIQHLCVDPVYRGKQLGARLLNGALKGFEEEAEMTTAVVFTENRVALRAFAKWGFRHDGKDKINKNFFGSNAVPVYQRTLKAPIERAIQKATTQIT